MRICAIKLPYEIQNLSDLVQERVCNICRVTIMVQNSMQEMRKIIKYIYFIHTTLCILRDRLYSAAEESKKVLLNIFNFEDAGRLFVLHSCNSSESVKNLIQLLLLILRVSA